MATSQAGFIPTRQNRLGAILHVVYEYANLVSAGYHSMNSPPSVRTHADDAFLLGYRKLSDFLTKDKREKDDLLAIDYLPSRSKPMWDLPTWRLHWSVAMNKQLTHITYARVLNPQPWDHRTWNECLLTDFRKAWGKFRAAVADPDFKAEFERQTAFCQGKPGFAKIKLP